MAKNKTVKRVKKTVKKKEIKNSADARIKFLHERLGELTYLITERTEELDARLRAFQRELSQDKNLKEMQKEANEVATDLQKLKKK